MKIAQTITRIVFQTPIHPQLKSRFFTVFEDSFAAAHAHKLKAISGEKSGQNRIKFISMVWKISD